MNWKTFTKAIKDTVWPRILETVNRHRHLFPHGVADVKLAWDGASYHAKAVRLGLLAALGVKPTQLAPHPPNSPDFQAPVEWSHSYLNRATNIYLQKHKHIRSEESIRELMEDIFYGRVVVDKTQAISAATVAGAFRRLERNYVAVMDAGGGWGYIEDT